MNFTKETTIHFNETIINIGKQLGKFEKVILTGCSATGINSYWKFKTKVSPTLYKNDLPVISYVVPNKDAPISWDTDFPDTIVGQIKSGKMYYCIYCQAFHLNLATAKHGFTNSL